MTDAITVSNGVAVAGATGGVIFDDILTHRRETPEIRGNFRKHYPIPWGETIRGLLPIHCPLA